MIVGYPRKTVLHPAYTRPQMIIIVVWNEIQTELSTKCDACSIYQYRRMSDTLHNVHTMGANEYPSCSCCSALHIHVFIMVWIHIHTEMQSHGSPAYNMLSYDGTIQDV